MVLGRRELRLSSKGETNGDPGEAFRLLRICTWRFLRVSFRLLNGSALHGRR